MAPALKRALANSLGLKPLDLVLRPVTGGCINQAARLEALDRSWFVKHGPRDRVKLFQAEQEGLTELIRVCPDDLRIPRVICCEASEAAAFLVLEWIDLEASGDWGRLGAALAHLHQTPMAGHGFYGFETNNFIGSTAQQNTFKGGRWAEFWVTCRIEPLLRKLRDGERRVTKTDRLLVAIGENLAEHNPPAAPLHGDLWSGNVGFDSDGVPVLFDPAFYRGDPETDLAFSRLFGGFGKEFYTAYEREVPTTRGAAKRRAIYNLYHALNHLLLFGEVYRPLVNEEVRKILDR